jgi:hypothetical protein
VRERRAVRERIRYREYPQPVGQVLYVLVIAPPGTSLFGQPLLEDTWSVLGVPVSDASPSPLLAWSAAGICGAGACTASSCSSRGRTPGPPLLLGSLGRRARPNDLPAVRPELSDGALVPPRGPARPISVAPALRRPRLRWRRLPRLRCGAGRPASSRVRSGAVSLLRRAIDQLPVEQNAE